MSEQMATMKQVREGLLNHLGDLGYSQGTITDYGMALTTMERSLKADNVDYSIQAADAFLDRYKVQYKDGNLSRDYMERLTRVTELSKDFYQNGHIKWKYYTVTPARTYSLPDLFKRQVDDYVEYMQQRNFSKNTIRQYEDHASLFLDYVQKQGISRLSDISNEVAAGFIQYAHSKGLTELDHPVGDAKRFLLFLASSNRIDQLVPEALNVKISRKRKIYYGFTREESDRMLAAVDTATPIGKRDYAILMLAKTTGLRQIDIVKLQRDDIKWEDGEIHIIQSKTQKPLILPLMKELGNAIEDYILNARPDSDCNNVFLRYTLPHVKMTDLHDIVNKYAKLSGVADTTKAKLTIHSFRRGLGVALLESDASLDMVKEIIGHSHRNATKKYLALETKHLGYCATPMSDFYTRKEAP